MLPLALPYFLANGRDLELIGGVLALVFWIQMIRFCLAREAPSPAKIMWLVFMVLVPGFGSLLYFFLRVGPRPRV
jgi:RsiW-degrading membrane proteinase PrsW (M82 family)